MRITIRRSCKTKRQLNIGAKNRNVDHVEDHFKRCLFIIIQKIDARFEHKLPRLQRPVQMRCCILNVMMRALLHQTWNFEMAQSLLAQLKDGSAKFADVLAFIEARYQHTPTAFQNGAQSNAETENQGSAKVLSFAQIEGLNQADTLSLFAEHYASVLATPEATDHQNIRQFMQNGWNGVKFEGKALTAK